MTTDFATAQAGRMFRVMRPDGTEQLLDEREFADFMQQQSALLERLCFGPERMVAPDGFDQPPIDLDAEGRTVDETMSSKAAAAVVQRWRDEGATWRYIALAAFHRWPHLRTDGWTAVPSNQLIGMKLCNDFGVEDGGIGP